MKTRVKILSMLLALDALTTYAPLHAELLILKQVEGMFKPLDDTDAKNVPHIEKILLKYQWPMSAAFALAPLNERKTILAETGHLFKPNKENAEEIFIEQKIRVLDDTYRVVFIPTALYELFVIKLLAGTYNETTPFQTFIKSKEEKASFYAVGNIIASNLNAPEIRSQISQIFLTRNEIFAGIGEIFSPHYYINQEIVNFLFTFDPELSKNKDSLGFSVTIESQIFAITADVISAILSFESMMRKKAVILGYLFSGLAKEPENKIIDKFIALEYEARKLNKALLVRGTVMIPFEKGAWKQESGEAAGTLKTKEMAGTTIATRKGDPEFEKAYIGQTQILPYSISFGNSLLAGIVYDTSACAYIHLQPYKDIKSRGYTLFIDKNSYIRNNNDELFSIAPLSTLAALFAGSEHFHSRSKVAVKAIEEPIITRGLAMERPMTDRAGITRVARDPLKHASLFSQFIADNGTIIQLGDESTLTNEEKAATTDLIQNQKDAAGYYKGIKGIKEKFMPKLERARGNIEKRKTSATSAPQETYELRALKHTQEQVAKEQLEMAKSK